MAIVPAEELQCNTDLRPSF